MKGLYSDGGVAQEKIRNLSSGNLRKHSIGLLLIAEKVLI